MPTLDDVVKRTAIFVGAEATGLPLSAEDGDLIKTIARDVIEELALGSVIVLPDEDDIPQEAVIALSQRIAVDCAAAFGTTMEALARLGITQFAAEARLRRVNQDRQSDTFVADSEYF